MNPDELKPLDLEVFRDVHFRIGLALWHGQAFEDGLSYYVTIILKLPPSRAAAEVHKTLEKMQSRTLGNLITELRKANSTNSVTAFEQRVNQFLADRNWLVHSSWRQHHGDLFQPQRALPLIKRLDEIAGEALALQTHLGELVRHWVATQGVDPAKVEAEERRILADRGII